MVIWNHIIIRDSLGVEIINRTLTADDQLIFYAAGYDAQDNSLGNQIVNWTLTGTLDGGDVSGTASYTFRPEIAPTSGSVTASVGNINDATGTISVTVGALNSISVNTTPDASGEPFNGAINITTDQSITLIFGGL